MNHLFHSSKFNKNCVRAVALVLSLFLALVAPVSVSAAEYVDTPAAEPITCSVPENVFLEPMVQYTANTLVDNDHLTAHDYAAYGVTAATVLSTTVNATIDMDTLFGGIVDIIIKMASYIGMILVIGGIFQLILAYKDDNADAQSKAIRYIVVGASLMGLRLFLTMSGIIN